MRTSPPWALEAIGIARNTRCNTRGGKTRPRIENAHHPRTVNDTTDMRAMKSMGTDGLITDYPNRART